MEKPQPESTVDQVYTIERARSSQDLEATRSLFAAYAEAMGLDLAFQGFDNELQSLPGKYAPPTGEILLARSRTGTVLGCVALRPLGPGCCEMKRLYILPDARGLGLGKKLIDSIIEVAAGLGYHEIKLDTLPSMHAAIALYTNAGFVPTLPYYDTPLDGTIFLARGLHDNPV
jgi:GNAT superfamily N-acetyltransferase